MKQRSVSRKAQLLFSIILLVSLLMDPGGNPVSSARAQKSTPDQLSPSIEPVSTQEFVIKTGNYEIPETLLDALKVRLAEINEASGGATSFGVGYFEEHPQWAWINLLVADGSYFDEEEMGPSFLYFAVSDIDAWRVVFTEDNQEYLSLLDSVPRDGLSPEELGLLDQYYGLNEPEADLSALAGNLLFPWSSSQNSWRFSSNGFHAAGFTSLGVESGAQAIDLVPPSSAQPAKVLAMETGTVVNKLECTWNTVLIVRHDGFPDSKKFVYLHLQNGTSPLGIGSAITQRGQYLGNLRTPVFNSVCSGSNCEIDNNPSTGNLCSISYGRHLHLGIGTDKNISIDGNVVANMTLGGYYNSSNTEGGGGGGGTGIGCDQVSYNGVVLYQNATCNKDQNGSKKEFSSSTGWTDIVSDFNDITSSIYVKPGWSLKVFEKSVGEGGGSWRCLTGSMWDLSVDNYTNGDTGRKINDDISSVQVYSSSSNCSGGGGGGTGTWNVKYFNGHDHWWDTNNFNNEMCQESITSTGLDKNYGSNAPCGNGVTDNWVAEYNATINFASGNYVFQAQNDDGLKMWLNGTNILERGGSQGLSYICPARPLNGNATIRAILNEEGGDARVKIAWTTDTSICNLPGSFSKASPSNGAWGQPTNPTLSWNSSSGANNYSYCIDTSNNNSCDTGWVGVGNVTSKSLSGLATGATYYWQVRAHSEGGETQSNGSAWWSFTTLTPVPSTPSNFRINSSTQTGITLAWDDVSNESGYNVYEWNGADFVYLASVGANTTSYTETRGECGWDEFYQVSAYNGNGESGRTGWIQGYTKPCNPTLNTPANGSSNPHNYDLTFEWNYTPGATEYLIEWWGGPYTTMQPCGWSSSTSCQIGPAFPGVTYSWRVKARNSAGESNWSNTWTFKVQAAPVTVTLYATAEDGWVLESSEASNQGGSMNATATSFVVGDDAGDKQYRGVLSFNTAGLPDNAVVTSVTFKIRQQSVTGTNPFSTHGNIAMDIFKGAFSGNTALQVGDFQATASKSAVATITNTPYASWYSKTLGAGAYTYINKGGVTQIRLRFGKDDNDDRAADYLRFYSGNATTANRPRLIIQYYIP